jgi:hypothetical protein
MARQARNDSRRCPGRTGRRPAAGLCWRSPRRGERRGQAAQGGSQRPRCGVAGRLDGDRRYRQPVRCPAWQHAPARDRDREPVGERGGLAPGEIGAAAGRHARDSQRLGYLWLAARAGPGSHVTRSWCDRMGNDDLRRTGPVPGRAAGPVQRQLPAVGTTGDSRARQLSGSRSGSVHRVRPAALAGPRPSRPIRGGGGQKKISLTEETTPITTTMIRRAVGGRRRP